MGRISRHRIRKIKKISIYISTVMILVLAVLAVLELLDNKKYSDALKQYEEQKWNYEVQITQLNEEIAEKENVVLEIESNMMPTVCMCIKADSVSELRTAVDWLEPYGCPISFVLDTELPESTISELLDEVAEHESWCVLLNGSGQSITEFYAGSDVQRNLQIIPLAYVDETIPEQLKIQLEEDGWLGYSESIGSMATQISTQINKDSFCEIGHVNLADQNHLGNVFHNAISKKSGFILSIDTDKLNESYTESSVLRIMEKIREEYLAENAVQACTVWQYIDEYRDFLEQRDSAQAELDEYKESALAEIARLEGEINSLREQYFPE